MRIVSASFVYPVSRVCLVSALQHAAKRSRGLSVSMLTVQPRVKCVRTSMSVKPAVPALVHTRSAGTRLVPTVVRVKLVISARAKVKVALLAESTINQQGSAPMGTRVLQSNIISLRPRAVCTLSVEAGVLETLECIVTWTMTMAAGRE